MLAHSFLTVRTLQIVDIPATTNIIVIVTAFILITIISLCYLQNVILRANQSPCQYFWFLRSKVGPMMQIHSQGCCSV